MTFETAKKLKDAGFPQTGENMVSHLSMKEKCNAIIMGESLGYVCIPTLSELIEACDGNKPFFDLCLCVDGWIAIKTKKGEKTIIGEGETPEEAVANLWLELNKK